METEKPVSQTAENTRSKIRNFAKLPIGWHYGEGGPIHGSVLDLGLAVEALLHLHGYPKTGAFPGIDGEIQVTGYRDGKCVCFEISETSYKVESENG